MEKLIFDVDTPDNPRHDVYISGLCGITRSAVQKYNEEKRILVCGKVKDNKYKPQPGDVISLEIPDPLPDKALAEDIPIEILFEDDYLAVVNKPKGMVVHPAPGNYSGTLVNALLYAMDGRLSSINGVIRPGIVHRIDKDTSGILIVAKTDEAHKGLAEQIKVHSFGREYESIIVGQLNSECGTIEGKIGRSPKNRLKMAVVNDGRDAITHYRVLERFDGYTYVRFILETGRTHQIRVHSSSIGHPVMGDILYGGGKTKLERQYSDILAGQCLHAKYIDFIHPITGEKLSFESPLPDYFKTILAKLRERQN